MTWQLLKNYLAKNDSTDDVFIQQCWSLGKEAVDHHIGTADVPSATYTQAVIECGAAYFNRRRTQQKLGEGIAQGVVFSSKDAMNSVYPMLAPYLRRF